MFWKFILFLIALVMIVYSINTYYLEKSLYQKILSEPKEDVVGVAPLHNIPNGTDNVVFGYYALYSLTPSYNNIAVGDSQLKELTSGNDGFPADDKKAEKEKTDEP